MQACGVFRQAMRFSTGGGGRFVRWACLAGAVLMSGAFAGDEGPIDGLYLAFHVNDEADLKDLEDRLGGRGAGARRLAVSTHFNPLGGKYVLGAPDFRVDEEAVKRRLEFLDRTGLPLVVGIFAGKFFSSEGADAVAADRDALMWDQDDQPLTPESIKGEKAGGTYFSISPSSPGGPSHRFLEVYERNTRVIAGLVAAWMKAHPGRVVGVSVAGETKYPPAKHRGGRKPEAEKRRWADYGPHALARFNRFIQERWKEHGVDAWRRELGVALPADWPLGTFDPPRGKGRGDWDRLDPSNPYFRLWCEFRVAEVKHHIQACARWVKEAGVPDPVYSHQAVWDPLSGEDPETVAWRGAPLATLRLDGVCPVLSLYGEKTKDAAFLAEVGRIGRGYPGRWGTLQYNPDGPEGSEAGYPVEDYLDRLKLLETEGCRLIGVYQWGAGKGEKHFVRHNFLEACARFLKGGKP